MGRVARTGWRKRFLKALGRTGNASLAARRAGVDKGTAYTWRRRDAGFAKAWERAKGRADERLRGTDSEAEETPLDPSARLRTGSARDERGPAEGAPLDPSAGLRTGYAWDERGPGSSDGTPPRSGLPSPQPLSPGGRGGSSSRLVVRFNKREGAQLVAAGAGRLSPEQQERFLEGLKETANVRASAAAVGVSTTALYNRRKLYPLLEAEWAAAKETGCRRVSLMLIEAAQAALDPEADAEALGLPRVSVSEAIAILKLHRFDEAGAPSHAGARAEARARAKAVEDMPIEAVRDEVMRRIEAIRAHREGGGGEAAPEEPLGPLHHAAHGHARVQTAPGSPQPVRGKCDPSIPRAGEES